MSKDTNNIYERIVDITVPVSSTVAEMTKTLKTYTLLILVS